MTDSAIDTGSQSRTVIRQKLAAYRRYAATGAEQQRHEGVFPLVVFLTTSDERLELLTDLIVANQTERAWQLWLGVAMCCRMSPPAAW
jgi:hypothetical protein